MNLLTSNLMLYLHGDQMIACSGIVQGSVSVLLMIWT